jgi:hypothetical protein
MEFPPASDYRVAVRRDDTGTDVAIIQMNLLGFRPKLPVDGVFGGKTDRAVRDYQSKHNLVRDGIAGLATQESIVVTTARPLTSEYDLPKGMLKSIAFNESSFQITNAAPHAKDGGWDAGPYARSSGGTFGELAWYESAFNAAASARWTADNAVKTRTKMTDPVDSRYLQELAFGDVERFRWMLTILAHNWPGNYTTGYGGAIGICKHGRASDDDDAPAEWIVEATRGALQTPRQWVVNYIAKATTFVEWN